MNKKYFILYFVFFQAFSSHSQDCYNLANKTWFGDDYSQLWLDHTHNGTIGVSNRRIQMRFLEISQHQEAPQLYNVKGKPKVGNNICDFSGTISIDSIKIIDSTNNLCESPDFPPGKVYCHYEFWEDSTQNHVGFFSGKLSSWFTKTQAGITKTNGWNTKTGNSWFNGTWKEYGKNSSKYCSFSYHIPPSFHDDLFKHYDNESYSINHKYFDVGWRTYALAHLNGFVNVPKNFDEDVKYTDDFMEFTQKEIEDCIAIEAQEWWN